mgnify:FL=1
MKIAPLVYGLIVGCVLLPVVRAEDAPAEPTSRLVERIQDKLGRKLAPVPRAKILEIEKEVTEKTKAAHTAYLKEAASASGFTEQGIEGLVSAEELMKRDADKDLVAAIQKATEIGRAHV